MRSRENIIREPAGLVPSGRGTNPNEELARALLGPVPGGKAGRKIRRRLSPVLGGRNRAGDRGRAPGLVKVREGRWLGSTAVRWDTRVEWRATKARPGSAKARNRARNKRARAARKAGR